MLCCATAGMAEVPELQLATEAPQTLECVARLLPSADDHVRRASVRALRALWGSGEEGRELVLAKVRQKSGGDAFLAEMARHRDLQSIYSAAGAALGGKGARRSGSVGQVIRIDGELALVVTSKGATVPEVLTKCVLRRVSELEATQQFTMTTAERSAATSVVQAAWDAYTQADNMALMATEQINDQCDAVTEELEEQAEEDRDEHVRSLR